MKKMLMVILLPMMMFAEVYIDVPCKEIIEVYKQLEGFSTKCAVNPNEYFLKQQFKNYQGAVTVDYVESDEFNVSTDNEGFIDAKIIPDKHFYLIAPNYKSDKLKLVILQDGSESWKYFYTGTSRWRKYDFAPINIEEEPVEVQVQETYPQIKHMGDQYPVVKLSYRIIWGAGWEQHKEGDPLINAKVKLAGVAGWEYIDLTDTNGTFSFDVTDRQNFYLYAWNHINNDWSGYKNRLSISSAGGIYERQNESWVKIEYLTPSIEK